MSPELPKIKGNKQNTFNLLIAAVTGQVGCLTLVIILGAVLGGMALDARYGTKPWFTVGLLVASIPISLVLMFFIVRKAVSKIKTGGPQNKSNEEDGIGKDS
ncbi:MAG: hypothetical protein FD147_1869 [Chloroflexi bacterium]|nr:MAG: hypothetical protein FD147_1869 [Chloroflexota bacterium]MBA4376306.1 hypothetical protein [Anaerolinea sp.]